MPILGVDRDRLVRVLQSLIGNAVRDPAQETPSEQETASEQETPSESETTYMKATTGPTPPNGPSSAIPPLADAPPPDVADASRSHGSRSKADARAHASSGPKRNLADAASSADIDALRDAIFGGQIREYERRFARMEERMAKELSEVREEVRDRCTALERYLRDEVESMTVELRANQQSHAVEERRLSQSIMDVAKGAEERIAALNDLVTKQQRELRGQLLDQSRSITDDVQRRYADLLARAQRDAAELRDGKADRIALSALLMEVALRLRGESVVPGESGEPRRD